MVPLSFAAFALPIPYLTRQVFHFNTVFGVALLCFGILLYNENINLQPNNDKLH